MTLIELFNGFHDATRRINLTSDARSLFLAFMQHWNAQRRPQAVDISVNALRETAKLDDESYRRAAICLSNLKLWKMKRKAHAKDGRFIYIGEFFLGENSDRRETVAEAVFSASPPTPPPESRKSPPSAADFPETKTEAARAQEKSPASDFSGNAEWFADKTFKDVYANKKAFLYLQDCRNPTEYDQILATLRKNECKLPAKIRAFIGE